MMTDTRDEPQALTQPEGHTSAQFVAQPEAQGQAQRQADAYSQAPLEAPTQAQPKARTQHAEAQAHSHQAPAHADAYSQAPLEAPTQAQPEAPILAQSVPVEVTARAWTAIAKYLKLHQAPEGAGLRIGLRGGGCSGLSYHLDIESSPRTNDQVLEGGSGLRVYVDPKSAIYLRGSTLDYVSGLMESGFKFINPKAGKSCGCGESFSPA